MKQIHTIAVLAIAMFMMAACKKESHPENQNYQDNPKSQRIISLSGPITEIVSALDYQTQIVGVDVTSTYPESIKSTAKDLGHTSSISIESILALRPTLILANNKDISPDLKEKIRSSGIACTFFDQDYTSEGTKKLIREVAGVLHDNNYSALQQKIDDDLSRVKPLPDSLKVLFIYARGANMLMVSGSNTPVDKVIRLAGARNAVTDFQDYKPLTPEALIKSNPDVLLLFDSGLESLGGSQGLHKIPGIDKTRAGKTNHIITMDGAMLSGFGPRVGEAAATLNEKLRQNAE